MNNNTAILFDMDGVLLDSETICDYAWEKVLKELNINDSHNVLNLCRGTNKHDTSIILKQVFGDDFDSDYFLKRTSEYFHEIEKTQGLQTMPYAKDILIYLKSKGYKIALVTSTRKETAFRQLKEAGLYDFFDTFTTGDMVIHSKPDPEIYLKAAKSLNYSCKDCIAVEDSPNGIKSAFNANMRTIMIPDKIQPSEEIKSLCWKIKDNLNELKEFL